MDKVTESLLGEFSKEHEIKTLKEDKRFEHFASYIVVRGEHTESFDTDDVVVGDGESSKGGADIGIDGIAITANGILVSDVEELEELLERVGYLTFRSSSFKPKQVLVLKDRKSAHSVSGWRTSFGIRQS